MTIELAEVDPPLTEWLLVTDKDSQIILSATDPAEVEALKRTAVLIRKSGGEVTVFKATKY